MKKGQTSLFTSASSLFAFLGFGVSLSSLSEPSFSSMLAGRLPLFGGLFCAFAPLRLEPPAVAFVTGRTEHPAPPPALPWPPLTSSAKKNSMSRSRRSLFCSSRDSRPAEELLLQDVFIAVVSSELVYDVSVDSSARTGRPRGDFEAGIATGFEALLGLKASSSRIFWVRGSGQLWAFLPPCAEQRASLPKQGWNFLAVAIRAQMSCLGGHTGPGPWTLPSIVDKAETWLQHLCAVVCCLANFGSSCAGSPWSPRSCFSTV